LVFSYPTSISNPVVYGVLDAPYAAILRRIKVRPEVIFFFTNKIISLNVITATKV